MENNQDYSKLWYSKQLAELQQAVSNLHWQLTAACVLMDKLYSYAVMDVKLVNELTEVIEDTKRVLCEYDGMK